MIIGIPKEIKDNENRVAITPAGVSVLAKAGHVVYIETNAGAGSGISDDEYTKAGAVIKNKAAEVFKAAEMIIKVKEPEGPELDLLQENQILFTYLHLAPVPQLTRKLQQKKIKAVAYETVELASGSLPLLTPMSEVAGRMAIQIGANCLEKHNGGSGVLLGGVPGVDPGYVVILGGGVVGTQAARIAVGLGASVVIIARNIERMRQLDEIFNGRVKTIMSNEYNISKEVRRADLLVGAVLVHGGRTPILVTEEMVKSMKPGSVIVDVAIDQGGCIETCDHPTTHSNPTYVRHGVTHYAVANMPGAVARTSTFALTNATLSYALEMANKGFEQAVLDNPALYKGVNLYRGEVVHPGVAASAPEFKYVPLKDLIC
jgi:alanine dehydrogenase